MADALAANLKFPALALRRDPDLENWIDNHHAGDAIQDFTLDHDTGIVTIAGLAINGRYQALEERLMAMGIPFDCWNEDPHDPSSTNAFWRPGMDDILEVESDGHMPMLPTEEFGRILEGIEAETNIRRIKTILRDWYNSKVHPVPSLEDWLETQGEAAPVEPDTMSPEP